MIDPVGTGVAVVVSVLVAALVGVGSPLVLRRLAEPAPGTPGAGTKQPYAGLATTRFALVVAALAFALTLLAAVRVPSVLLPPWLAVTTAGLLAVAVDARTTWLPRRLTQAGWLLGTAGLLTTAALAGPGPAGRGVVGALLAGAVFWLLWRLTRGGIGFGDVRLMPVLGAATGTLGTSAWLLALMLGTLAGAIWAVLLRARGRRSAFAYAPPLAAGPFLMLLFPSTF